jgi:prepilin-type N-terminal cleavage/methylation domain-containing protein
MIRVSRRARLGFTLIELMVVVSIISLLTSIVSASLDQARKRTRDAKRISDMAIIQVALELYHNDYGRYPDAQNDTQRYLNFFDGGIYYEYYINVDYSNMNGPSTPGNVFMPELVTKGYLPKYLLDPKNDSTYYYQYIRLNVGQLQGYPGTLAEKCGGVSDLCISSLLSPRIIYSLWL